MIWKIETHNKTPSSPSNATLRKYDQSSITLRIIESEEWKKQYLLLLFCSYCYWMVIGSLSKCSEPKVRERIFFVLLPNAIKCSRKVVIWRKIEKIVFAEVILIVNALLKSHATSCMSQNTKTKQNLSFVFCWSVWLWRKNFSEWLQESLNFRKLFKFLA